jgi:thioesterase domain-containing protein
VRLFAEIERAFGKTLPLATLFQSPTIEELAKICRDLEWTAPWRSLVPIQPQGEKPPLFFVHGIYGNVLYFRDLANYLGLDQPFYGLQAKGIDGKQTPYTKLEDMAAHYIKEMRELQPTGPYFLGGHSFGCILAFEIAQQLYAQGQKVALLALLDEKINKDEQIPFSDWISGHMKNFFAQGVSDRVNYITGRIQNKIDQKIPKELLLAFRKVSGTKVSDQREIFRNVSKANFQALSCYKSKPYPGKVTLFKAKLGSPKRYALDPLGGWGKIALGGVDMIEVPGDHYTIIKEPHLPVLAAEIKMCLDKAQGNQGDP